MSNSPLVSYTALSPNCSPRTGKIDRITIHHMAGVVTVEQCGNTFASPARQASANYGIGNDGRVGLYVPEDKRSWCSSSTANDNRAVTIEVSNSEALYPWPVSAAAYMALIELCADICKRNGIEKLVYTGDTTGNLTAHRWFAATQCPGDYLYERFPAIAEEVNRRLRENDEEDDMTYYKHLSDVPEWYKPAVQKAIDAGALEGTGDGINVSEDLCRTLTVLDRMGKMD